MKESYYFSHDATAQDDEKIMNLMADHGWSGYGIFWGLIEKLRSATDYRFKIKSIKGIALKMGVVPEVLHSIIFDFELFVSDDEYFWSESLLRRMELREAKTEQARTAGQRSGEVRRQKMNDRSTDVQQAFNDSSTECEQLKEIKGNEILIQQQQQQQLSGESAEVVEIDLNYEIQEYFKKHCPPGSNPMQEAKIFIDMNSIKNWGAVGGKENWGAVADLYIRKIKVKNSNNGHNGNNGNRISKVESASSTLRKWAERKGITGEAVQ